MSEQTAVRPEVVRSMIRITADLRAFEAEVGADTDRAFSDLSDAEFPEWMPAYAAIRDALRAVHAEATDEEWHQANDALNGPVPA